MATRRKIDPREAHLQAWVDCLNHPTGTFDDGVWELLSDGLSDAKIRDALLTIHVPGGVEDAWRSVRGEPAVVIGAIDRIIGAEAIDPPLTALARSDAIMAELIRRARVEELDVDSVPLRKGAGKAAVRKRRIRIDALRSRQGRAMTMIAWNCWWRGDSQEALDAATEALALDLGQKLPELIAKLVLANLWPGWVSSSIEWTLAVRGGDDLLD